MHKVTKNAALTPYIAASGCCANRTRAAGRYADFRHKYYFISAYCEIGSTTSNRQAEPRYEDYFPLAYCAKMNRRVRPARVVVIGNDWVVYGMLCLRS